ncbi:hypothetical protein [Georgenia sp. H159]|uniref:hypothetical protein n=1 Tax=Georgenia sp. H159 TaxID=3076115 RepID=UPI002D785EED|nr:hypothetical protein [Georgenia sp. H159]
MTESQQPASLPLGLAPGDLATAAMTGLLTLPDPARRSPLGRFALRSAAAGTVAVGTWVALGQDARSDVTGRVAFTVGAAGLMYGLAELGEAMDGAVHRRLVRSGVRRPRVAMALAGVGLALAMSVLERREDDGEVHDHLDEPVLGELPVPVRALIGAILEQTEDHDSLRLRAQLAVAGEARWGEEPDSHVVDLVVPDDVPLAVPHAFTFPVSARFVSARGVPCTARLIVADGRLSVLVVDVDDEAWEPVAADWDAQGGDPDPLADITVPRVEDVTFVTEGHS